MREYGYSSMSKWLWQDHTKPEFVDGRRRGLASYLGLLCSIPRMTALTDFKLFLGIADGGVYERSHVFQVRRRCSALSSVCVYHDPSSAV